MADGEEDVGRHSVMLMQCRFWARPYKRSWRLETFSMRPYGARGSGWMGSPDCASLHPGLLSIAPSGRGSCGWFHKLCFASSGATLRSSLRDVVLVSSGTIFGSFLRSAFGLDLGRVSPGDS